MARETSGIVGTSYGTGVRGARKARRKNGYEIFLKKAFRFALVNSKIKMQNKRL
nr:MAG TPA: hypothetical protein [Bacteriophage sp.]